jgi:L-alanine-DL-glutamate epimerase-like enolase superfamily enzyme
MTLLRNPVKIREIRAAGLRGYTPAGGWTNELKPTDVVHTLISIHTDEGPVGVGSAFTSESLVRASLELLNDSLIGENALEPQRLSETLHQQTFWQGRGGAVTHAISGIDIALWDLFGQAVGQPISRLLGGTFRDRVRPYASVLMDTPDILVPRLEALLQAGYNAFKIGWGPFGRSSPSLDRQMVSVARDAIGPHCLLAVDAGGSDGYWPSDLKWAINAAHMLKEFDVAWFEEPLSPDDHAGFADLRSASPVPISGGEVLTRRQSFEPYLTKRLVDIVQPDVTKVGGITEFRRIAQAAEDNFVRVIPHGWNTAVGLAADLHLAAALPLTDLVEYCIGSEYIDDLVAHPWTLDENGTLEIPTGPGLGLELDHDKVRHYTGGFDLFTP